MRSATNAVFHASQPFINGAEFGVGQLRPLYLAWLVAELVSAPPSLLHSTRASSLELLCLGHPMLSLAGGKFSNSAFMPSRLAHQHPQLHYAAQSRRRAHSPKCSVYKCSPTFTPSGLVHPCLINQDQHYCAA